MITDRPCCDNCPHYIVEKKPCGAEAGHGLCFYDSPSAAYNEKGEPKHCTFIVDATHRCSNHPWVARVTSEAVANYAASWREYIDDLPLLIDVMAGGGTGSCDANPKRSDAEKLRFARKALTIIRLKKDLFDQTEDRMEELDAVIAMDESARSALRIIDDEEAR